MLRLKQWVINLDRRRDRLDSFRAAHAGTPWATAERWPAIDGRSLVLTADLARRLAPNDFFWKKSVSGCALSHIGLWEQLIGDSEADAYLIFEDDARVSMTQRMNSTGASAADNDARVSMNYPAASPVPYAPPQDADIVYLGGILPHNRATIDRALAGLSPATNPFFRTGPTIHFCAYAYILTKAGARKLFDIIAARGGIYTSIDLLMSQNAGCPLNIYCYNPMIAGCSQDTDPAYQRADFNNMLRVDEFDSDIWNQAERWSEEEWSKHVRTPPAWAKKLGFQEVNPAILNHHIASDTIPIIVGTLPPELKRAIPLMELERDEDAWALIDLFDANVELREKYRRDLRKSIGIIE
jgi:GR25 family glycosyltransferase involved in LPS biosynthesis